MVKSIGTEWAIRTSVQINVNSGVIESYKAAKISELLKAPLNIRDLFGPSLTGQMLVFQIMDRQSGETGTFAFVGPAVSIGFGRNSASISDWTPFETENAQRLEDFRTAARLWGGSAGAVAGWGFGGIVFQGIDMKYDSLAAKLWWNDLVDVGGKFLGIGGGLSEAIGMVQSLHRQPYADPDSGYLIVWDDLDNPPRGHDLDLGAQSDSDVPDAGVLPDAGHVDANLPAYEHADPWGLVSEHPDSAVALIQSEVAPIDPAFLQSSPDFISWVDPSFVSTELHQAGGLADASYITLPAADGHVTLQSLGVGTHEVVQSAAPPDHAHAGAAWAGDFVTTPFVVAHDAGVAAHGPQQDTQVDFGFGGNDSGPWLP